MRTIVYAPLLAILASSPLYSQNPNQPPPQACKPGDFTVIGYPAEFGPQAEGKFQIAIDERFQGRFLTQGRIWLPSIEQAIDKWNGVPGSRVS